MVHDYNKFGINQRSNYKNSVMSIPDDVYDYDSLDSDEDSIKT